MPTIIRMVNHTRLDCLLGSTAVDALGQWRRPCTTPATGMAFGKLLADQPAMQNVLADLAIESEAATAAALRVARAYDEGDDSFRRFATAVMKYWVCKRAPAHAVEALECLGGNGFVEESGLPRLYRDAPLNSIWEGSGNVAALDVLRALVEGARGAAGLPRRVRARARRGRSPRRPLVRTRCPGEAADPQWDARRMVEDLGAGASRRACSCATLRPRWPTRSAPARLGDGGRAFGTLPAGVDAPVDRRARAGARDAWPLRTTSPR